MRLLEVRVEGGDKRSWQIHGVLYCLLSVSNVMMFDFRVRAKHTRDAVEFLFSIRIVNALRSRQQALETGNSHGCLLVFKDNKRLKYNNCF